VRAGIQNGVMSDRVMNGMMALHTVCGRNATRRCHHSNADGLTLEGAG